MRQVATNDVDRLALEAEQMYLRGEFESAYKTLLDIFKTSISHGRTHYIMALLAIEKLKFKDAITLLDRAIYLDGLMSEYLVALAECHITLRNRVAAREAALAAFEQKDISTSALNTLSGILHALALFEDSLQALEELVRRDPSNSILHANLGAVRMICGDRKGSLKALGRAIELDDKNVEAFANVSASRRATVNDNHITQMSSLLVNTSDIHDKIKIYHALSREYDDIGEYDDSFSALTAAKSLYNLPEYCNFDYFSKIVDFMNSSFATSLVNSEARPIFIVGTPRSGTTLLERIVTHNTGIASLGESTFMIEAMRGLDVPNWSKLDFARIGTFYSDYAKSFSGNAARTVDKFPLNLLLAPAIMRALPNAKFICAIRHPLDAIIGNYRLLFALDASIYHYNANLSDTARFVAHAHKLAEELARARPNQFHIVYYEDLVDNPACVGKAFVEFCEIPWTEGLLKIENNKLPAGSASAGQVHAPIQSDHKGRWRNYKEHLTEAMTILDQMNVSWR